MVRLILLISSIGIILGQHGTGSHDTSHSTEAGHSMNWLSDWLMPDPGLFIWTLITFFIVLFILKAQAWGPLMNALDAREKRINEALSSADKAKEEAEKVSDEYDNMIKKAQSEALDIVAKSKAAGEKLKSEIEHNAKQKADELVEKTKNEINAAKAKAIEDIKLISVDLAIQAASKVLEKNLDDSSNKDLAKKTINEAN